MLELQRFAAVDSSCRRRLLLVCSSSIDLLHFDPMLHARQQELLRVFGSVREPVERALKRGLNGRVRRRLRRARRVGVRSSVMCSAGRTRNARACMRMPAHTSHDRYHSGIQMRHAHKQRLASTLQARTAEDHAKAPAGAL